MKKKIGIGNTFKMLYIAILVIIVYPFFKYWIINKSVIKYVYMYTFSACQIGTEDLNLNFIAFIVSFGLLTFVYFQLIKYREEVFKNIKQIMIFTAIVAILFAIIIPVTSSDVYSYIASGWIDSHYGENPYYIATNQITNASEEGARDEMFFKVARCWREEPVVYGPAWIIICKGLTLLSFGDINIALISFKIASVLALMACTLLIYKITNKKLFTTLFALNPLVLFETIANVHNDIFLVLFVLLSLYMVVKKKNLFVGVLFLAIATAIKYLSILLLPFLLLYALKEEKIAKRIQKSILYFIEYVACIVAFYLIYARDLEVLAGIFVQQSKYSRSIFLGLWYLFNGKEEVLLILKNLFLLIFIVAYGSVILKLYFTKDLKITKLMQKYQVFLLIFTLVLITNFNSWYLLWLLPTIMWQKAKMIRFTNALTIGGLMAYAISYATYKDDETVGIAYFCIMIIVSIAIGIKISVKTNDIKTLKK